MVASGNTIVVDPGDPRGWEIVRGLGRGHQPALIDLWRRAVRALAPDVVVDVGANYGEMVLSGSYPRGTRALAVEANPRVAACLRRGMAAHPDSSRIELHQVLASDVDGGTAILHVDPRWSGSASVALQGDGLVAVEAPVRTIDHLVGGDLTGHDWVVKVDAEGWEAHILRGMHRSLQTAASTVLVVEFDPEHLRRAGTEPGDLFTLVGGIGPCWHIGRDGTLSPAREVPTDPTDLLVCSSLDVARRLDALVA